MTIQPNALIRTLARAASAVAIALVMAATFFCSAAPAPAAPARPGQVSLNIAIFKEVRSQGADGATDVRLVAADKAAPGDRLVYVLTYRNTGSQPVSNLIVDYPMPKGVSYRAPAEGSLPPLVSADGVHFGQPGDMTGGSRPGPSPDSAKDSITALRWQVDGAVAPGAQGEVSFKATLN